ncbi:GNAT family N-acetyltransferase [Pseudoalteromonas fenneropenaei]|uniref:GNAT family N-acetyltransferase n=1 Tax=Pseudoalteromonas fenneropenaei TaxID=1737459 RepID=A0ABV7CG48_9GAMM
MNKVTIRPGNIADIAEIEQHIPEFVAPKTTTMILQRLADKPYLLLVAYDGDKPVAYKLGYQLAAEEFYSWLGAVLPSYRGQGIARRLLLDQELWCQTKGYQAIRVKSMNCFKTMLQMLISHDYHIVGCETAAATTDPKIHFYKRLK